MRRVVVLPAAIDDLDEIFAHTVLTWNPEQAARYVDQLEHEFIALAARSSPGRPLADVHPHLRKQLVGSHVVYFFVDDDELTISRVLHTKMSPDLHTF